MRKLGFVTRATTGLSHWFPTPLMKLSLGVHGVAAGGLALAPRQWPFWIGALVADHALVVGAGLWPRSTLLGPNLRRLGAAGADEVALTFDDGPDPDVTPRVLDLLDAAAARATFFCVGRRVEQHPGVAAEIVRRGHTVENHSWKHRHTFSLLSPGALGREIDLAQAAIERATGRRPTYFRAPAGLRNAWLEPVLRRRGLTLVSWSRRAFDTVNRDAQRVVARLTEGVRPGDILLMHDGAGARGTGGRPVVLAALPPLLEALRECGLRSVPLTPGRAGR